MKTITIDGITVQVADDTAASVIANALSGRDVKVVQLTTDSAALQAKFDQAQAQLDQAKENAEKAAAEITQLRADSADPERILIFVCECMMLMQDASKLLDSTELQGLDLATDDEVRRVAVRKHTKLTCDSDENSPEYRSPEYVAARFDALVDDAGERNHQRMGKVITIAGNTQMRTDADDESAQLSARIKKAMNEADNAWRQPQSNTVVCKEV